MPPNRETVGSLLIAAGFGVIGGGFLVLDLSRAMSVILVLTGALILGLGIVVQQVSTETETTPALSPDEIDTIDWSEFNRR